MNREVKINPLLASKRNSSQPQGTLKQNTSSNSDRLNSSSVKKSSSKPPKKRKVRKGKKQRKIALPKLNIPQNVPIPSSVSLLCRLTVIAVGVGTILGSTISIINSFDPDLTVKEPNASPAITATRSSLENRFSLIAVGEEIAPLKKQLTAIADRYPELDAGIVIANINSKNFVNLEGTTTFAAASTIKIPILVAFFQDVDAKKIKLTQPLAITSKSIAGGSGDLQHQSVGKKYSALEVATKMITISDNTATNMLIDYLGGIEALNQRFAEWGLNATRISDRLPDTQGQNTTSPEDLSNLLLKIDRGELVSLSSRDRILAIMKQTEKDTLLPQGLGRGSAIAHKTGTLRSLLADTGIIYAPNGQRYIASVLVKRNQNDPQAENLIQEVSRTAYQYFQRSASLKKTLPKPRSFLAE